jgi:hypothetical protein
MSLYSTRSFLWKTSLEDIVSWTLNCIWSVACRCGTVYNLINHTLENFTNTASAYIVSILKKLLSGRRGDVMTSLTLT